LTIEVLVPIPQIRGAVLGLVLLVGASGERPDDERTSGNDAAAQSKPKKSSPNEEAKKR